MDVETLSEAETEETAIGDPGTSNPMEEKVSKEERQRFLAGFPEGQRCKVEKRLAEMPEQYRRYHAKGMSVVSRAAAMKAFCLECVGWQREEVQAYMGPAGHSLSAPNRARAWRPIQS